MALMLLLCSAASVYCIRILKLQQHDNDQIHHTHLIFFLFILFEHIPKSGPGVISHAFNLFEHCISNIVLGARCFIFGGGASTVQTHASLRRSERECAAAHAYFSRWDLRAAAGF